MTVLFRCRVDPRTLKKCNKVTEPIGIKTPEVVRIAMGPQQFDEIPDGPRRMAHGHDDREGFFAIARCRLST